MPSVEIPFPPKRDEPRGARMEPPWVPIEPVWEYKEIGRDVESERLLSEVELNALGTEHWELAGVVREGPRVHFYFKRERIR